MAKKLKNIQFTEDEIQEDFKSFERLLRILTSEYNQFFAGALKTVPAFTEGELRKIIKKYQSGELLAKGTDRYRFYNLVARFNSFREMWGRKLRNMENATLSKDFKEVARQKEAERLQEEQRKIRERFEASTRYKFTTVTKDPTSDKASLEAFYQHFKEAHRISGQPKDALTEERFKNFISKQVDSVKAKKSCDAVKFTLAIRDGEVKLTAKPVKKD